MTASFPRFNTKSSADDYNARAPIKRTEPMPSDPKISTIYENLRIFSEYALKGAHALGVGERSAQPIIEKKGVVREFFDGLFADQAVHRQKLKNVLLQTVADLKKADRSWFVLPNHEYTDLFCAAQKFNQIVMASKQFKSGLFAQLNFFPLLENAAAPELAPLVVHSVTQTSLPDIPSDQKPFVRKEGLFWKHDAFYYDKEDAKINHYVEGLRIFLRTQWERILSVIGRALEAIARIFGQNLTFFSGFHYFRQREEKIYRKDSPIAEGDLPTSYWIGHATCFMKIPKTTSSGKKVSINLITDPVEGDLNRIFYPRQTRPGRTMDECPAVHVYLLSHNHLDHYDQSTIDKLLLEQPAMLVPWGDGEKFKSRGFKNVYELQWWQKTAIQLKQGEETVNLTITGVPSHHWAGQGTEFHAHTTGFLGYVIEGENESGDLYFAGDTARLSEEHIETLRNRFNIRTQFQPGGPDELRKDMESTHQSSADALWMHFNLLVKKLYKSSPALNKQQFIEKAKGLRTLFMHTKTFKLGNLHFDDTEASVQRVLDALAAKPQQLPLLLAKMQVYERRVYDELLVLGKEMRFGDQALEPADIYEILRQGVYLPMIGERTRLIS